jgi:biotin carboxyl carrier protein
MEFSYQYDSQAYDVTILKVDDRYHITIDGDTHVVDGRLISSNLISLIYENQSHRVFFDQMEDRKEMSVRGSHFVLKEGEQEESESDVDVVFDGKIKTPMPGKVVKVFVREHDAVKSGDALFVVEAMKMEHVVSAPLDGVINQVSVIEGQNIGFGELLGMLDITELNGD